VLPPQIFTYAREWPRFTHQGGGPPTIFNSQHSKIGLKLSGLAIITLGPVGVTS